MPTAAPFLVTAEALKALEFMLRQNPGMDHGLKCVLRLEILDDHGAVEASLDRETLWMAYDPPDKRSFSTWPRVELCGQSIPIASDALERPRGRTLTAERFDSIFEGPKLLVAA